jgi:hypothetical protein
MDWAKLRDLVVALEAGDADAIAAAGEARFRCIISRAYYAALCYARDLTIARLREKYRPSEVHARVPVAVLELGRLPAARWAPNGLNSLSKVSHDLERLRRSRVTADYDSDQSCTAEDARRAVEMCRRVFATLDRIPWDAAGPSSTGTPANAS